MPKYIVTVREVHCQGYEIDAASENEAIALMEAGEGEPMPSLFEYSHTLDKNTWTVEEDTYDKYRRYVDSNGKDKENIFWDGK